MASTDRAPESTSSASRDTRASLRFVAEERLVVAVVLAHELVDLVVLLKERERPPDHPGAGKDVRIVDRRFVLERVEGGARETLDDVERLGVAIAVDLGLVVESDGIDNQRVALPASDGVAHPRRIRISWM